MPAVLALGTQLEGLAGHSFSHPEHISDTDFSNVSTSSAQYGMYDALVTLRGSGAAESLAPVSELCSLS